MSTVDRTSSETAPPDPDTAPPDPGTAPPAGTARRRGRRRLRAAAAVAGAVAVTGVATAAALGALGGAGDPASSATHLPPATAEVTRTTMVQTETFDGTLDYGAATTVLAAGGEAGQATGILTWRPGIGQTITRGEPLYSVDAEPVVLCYGEMPFFRTLGPGDSGHDVEQLEENLAALDYDGFTVDDEFTDATAAAVAQWQEDLELVASGRFEPSRVVVAPGAVRVDQHLAPLGAAAGGEVLAFTGTTRMVTVELEVADQQYVAEEMAVTVTLPDGVAVDATVSDVGTVATTPETEPGEEATTTVEVLVSVDDPEALGDWDAAPVEVDIEVDRREDVLAVPVGALLALAEGGYGVQVVDGDATSYLAVTTGMFADGLVEISGDGVAEGMTVGVPS